jgi:hypothetical protein
MLMPFQRSCRYIDKGIKLYMNKVTSIDREAKTVLSSIIMQSLLCTLNLLTFLFF